MRGVGRERGTEGESGRCRTHTHTHTHTNNYVHTKQLHTHKTPTHMQVTVEKIKEVIKYVDKPYEVVKIQEVQMRMSTH